MLLLLHSLLRWLVLFGGLAATVLAFQAYKGKPWSPLHKGANLLFLIALDTQYAIGTVTWLQSPLVAAARADLGAAMREPILRFFAVEHPAYMLLALIAMHVGFAKAKRAGADLLQHRAAFLLFATSTALLLLGIPWPWRAVGRPLLSL